MGTPQNQFHHWIKTQKKYRNLQRRIQTSQDVSLISRLSKKLDLLNQRLFRMNRKWYVGVAAGVLMAWLAAFPANAQTSPIELSSLDGTNGFVINGEVGIGYTGTSVGVIGDINADGFDDIILGAPGSEEMHPGAAYVVFGTDTGFGAALNLSSLDGTNGFQLLGVTNYDWTGFAVGGGDDVNGDGINDLIVGAPEFGLTEGKAFVVFGKATPFSATLNLGSLNGSDGFLIDGLDLGDDFGDAVALGGDVNGDGFGDILIGDPLGDGADASGSGAGDVYVIFGKNTAFESSFDVSTLNGSNGVILLGINGGTITSGDGAGASVDFAGDINGDGIDDLIIGAPRADFIVENVDDNEGEVYVVFGTDLGFAASKELSMLDGIDGFRVTGISQNGKAGRSVSGAGDINDDGIADVVIGSFADETYVIFGKNTAIQGDFSASFSASTLNGTNGFTVESIFTGDYAGFSVNDAGDFNGDGIDDVIIGGIYGSPGITDYAGQSYVVFGSDLGFGATFQLSSLDGSNGIIINGIDDYDYSGHSVSSAGDLNGDGFGDVLIGAIYGDPSGNDEGEAYVVFGPGTVTGPSNDLCMDAVSIACGDEIAGTTISGTVDTGVAPDCGSATTTGPGVWYHYVGTGETVDVSTCNAATFDTSISVFTGTCEGGFTCVAGNDDGEGCSGFTSSLEFNSTLGTEYFFLVHTFSTAEGDFTLSVTCTETLPPPPNDECVDAELLTVFPVGTGTSTPGTNENATNYTGQLGCDPFSNITDVWYTFNSGSNEIVRVMTTLETAGDLNIALYNDCEGDEVFCDDDFNDQVFVDVAPATEYWIQVWNDDQEGTFTILLDNCDLDGDVLVTQEETCEGADDVAINIEASGGTTPYEYSLDGINYQAESTFENLTPGFYSFRVRDDLDCEITSNIFIVPAQDPTWYLDNDEDGFGDPATFQVACEQPVGYVDNDDDCDDNDEEATNVDITWYADVDGDTFGDPGSFQSSCTRPTDHVTNDDDCDDSDGGITTGPTWYEDFDNDGFGNAASTTMACTQPLGYVADDTDCDDEDPLVNTDGTDVAGSGVDANCDGQYLWFVDGDGDTYGTTSPTSSANSTPGPGESDTDDDCDDVDPNINPGVIDLPGSGEDNNCDGQYVWYTDGDGDLYAGTGTTSSGNASPGAGEYDEALDCNDSDASINPGATDVAGSGVDANCDGQYLWYLDSDDDGYGVSSTVSSSSSTPGTNESATSDDCDDSKAGINPGASDVPGSGEDVNCDGQYTWYTDADGDGYAGSGTVTSANSTAGTGEFATNTDCDDTDAAINPDIKWYADTDGDGFGNPSNFDIGCVQPTDHVANSLDCNDGSANISPNGTDVAGSGIDANCDGKYLWFTDADGDGYAGTGTVSSTNATAGTGEFATSDDCDDTDATLNPQTKWYADEDGDGYGNPDNFDIACLQPANHVENNLDCNPGDPNVYPGALALPDGKDNDCDGTVDKVDQTITLESIPDQLHDGSTYTMVGSSTSGLDLNYGIVGPADINVDVLTFQGAGSVTLTATQPGDNGYLPAKSVSVTFCVNPVPEISIATDNVAVLVLESNYGTGNQWYLDGSALSGEANQQHLVAETGEYTVEVSIDGCVGESGAFNAVLTNVDEVNGVRTTLFPNPVSKRLNIQITDLDRTLDSEVLVIDLNGSILMRDRMAQSGNTKSIELDVSTLSDGNYFLMIRTGDQVIRERFSKF